MGNDDESTLAESELHKIQFNTYGRKRIVVNLPSKVSRLFETYDESEVEFDEYVFGSDKTLLANVRANEPSSVSTFAVELLLLFWCALSDSFKLIDCPLSSDSFSSNAALLLVFGSKALLA